MDTIAERVRHLKGSQSIPQFAKLIGEEKAQRLQDVLSGRQRIPEDMLLRILSATGCDANWLLLGKGEPSPLSSDELELLALFRQAPLPVKAAAVGALRGARSALPGSQVQVTALGGHAAARDINIKQELERSGAANKNHQPKRQRSRA